MYAIRSYYARTADEGVNAQALGPLAQRVGAEGIQLRGHPVAGLVVAPAKGRQWLAVGEVEPATAGLQELAAHRGHAVIQIDGPALLTYDLGGKQAGRPAAYDAHRRLVRRIRLRWLGHGQALIVVVDSGDRRL